MWLVVQTAGLLALVVASYQRSSITREGGYLEHPLWLGLSPGIVRILAGAQVVALVAYLTWVVIADLYPPSQGPLATTLWLHGLNMGFLLLQASWPHLASPLIQHTRNPHLAFVACVPLWLSALCINLLVGGTFAAQEQGDRNPVPIVSILLVALVITLIDGVGWTARAIFQAMSSTGGSHGTAGTPRSRDAI